MSKEAVKFRTDRNEPRVSFQQPKFTKYSYVDKKDGRKRTVVRCEIISFVKSPGGNLVVDSGDDRGIVAMGYPLPKVRVKTIGKAICDERDDFDYELGKRVARIRAEKKAFSKHAKLAKKSVKKVIDFYQNALERFVDKSAKVVDDPIIWEK